MENIKQLDSYLVTSLSHIYELPYLFLAIEQVNPGCVVIWKTCEIKCQTLRYSNVCSGHSSHLLKGSNIVVPL